MKICLLGVPSDLGANKDGSGKGAAALRKHAALAFSQRKIKYFDYGNVGVPRAWHIDEDKRRHYRAIKKLSRNYKIKNKWTSVDDCFPVIFGGDHSITMFHMGELSKEKKVGLLYFDSHGDFNTPKTTPSGNVHGMVVSRCVGRALLDLMPWKRKFVDEKNVVLIGIRDLDQKEKELLRKSKVTVITMKELKKRGCKSAIEKALKIVNNGTEGFHLSIDMDVVDPKYAPAVSTPVKGGLTKKDLLNVMKMARDRGVLSADFVEYIPKLDKNNKTASIVCQAVLELVR